MKTLDLPLHRYDHVGGADIDMRPNPEGDWVPWADVEMLLDELATLQAGFMQRLIDLERRVTLALDEREEPTTDDDRWRVILQKCIQPHTKATRGTE